MSRMYDSRLWLIKAQNVLTARTGSRLLASFLLLYAPLLLLGSALQVVYDYQIFSRGVLMSTLWLGFAPFLIQDAWRIVHEFFEKCRDLFAEQETWADLKKTHLRKFESKQYIWFAIPWALALSIIINFVIFREAPLAIQGWCLLTYFIMFFVSAIGFQGILVVIRIIASVLKNDLRFRPYHPDSFGGLQFLSNFSVKGTFYFSSGALVFPLVFELLRTFSTQSALLDMAILTLTGLFLALLIYSFLSPLLQIKDFIDDRKCQQISESQLKLRELYEKVAGGRHSMAAAINLFTYNELYHKKLYEIKDYPYDIRVVFELFLSLLIPIIIAVLEKFIF